MSVKKVFKVEGLDCGHCADRVEKAVSKIEGINSANVSFMTQRLEVEVDDSYSDKMDELAQEIAKACKKLDSNFIIKI